MSIDISVDELSNENDETKEIAYTLVNVVIELMEVTNSETVEKLVSDIKKLSHHYNSTVGLWATDRPDCVEDIHKLMWKIEPIKELKNVK